MNRREALKNLAATGIGIGLTSGVIEEILNLRSIETPSMEVPEEINLIADIILPRTDTPGALDVGAPRFAMYMLKEIRPLEQQVSFDEGLTAFRQQCIDTYGMKFADLTSMQQESLLRNLIDSKDKFFNQIHGLILISYFTSEEGMTKALVYNPVPMEYQPCVPVDNNTRGEASYF